jgi:hypothetical protein
MNQAHQEYKHMETETRGSPQPYRLIAALTEMSDDEEIPKETHDILSAFSAKMSELGSPTEWERYVQVCRTAGTRDRAVKKFHLQLSLLALTEFPDFAEAFRIALRKRGWTPKDSTAPTSQAFKSVISSVSSRREWS